MRSVFAIAYNLWLLYKTRTKIILFFICCKLKIVQLQIHNLLSYTKVQKLQFANYTLIVGPNASGKTNLARILSFLREPGRVIDEKRLPLDMKFDHERPSHLQIDIQLNKEEMRILTDLMFDKTINTNYYDTNMTTLSVFLEWTSRFEERAPSSVILYFYNHFIVWTEGMYLNASYVKTSLKDIDDIKSEIAKAIDIERDQKLKERYREQNGFYDSELFNQQEFQDRLIEGDTCSGKNLGDYFEIDSKRIRIKMQPFVVAYNSDRTDDQNAHAVRILKYLGRKTPTANSANLWLVVSRFLQNMTIQEEVRPDLKSLSGDLVRIKDSNIDRYDCIVKEFSAIFPNVSFDASSQDVTSDATDSLPTPRIMIKELDPFTGSTYTYSLQDSASGYNELLHLLLQKTQAEDNILILDEPALHLHPTKIRQLSRRLIGSSRQIILITHSPFFVDVSNLGLGNSLIYIKRDGRSSSVSSKTNNQSVEIKSYIFDPNVFFSKFNILVEGPGDAASFFAISDSLDSVFEKYNIIVINAGGDGNIDAYIKLMELYQIPYVAMVDNQYMGINTTSDKFVRLNNKLEYELKAAGWQGSVEGSIDPNAAYEFVFDAIQTGNAKKIRSTLIGVIFDRALTSIGEVPDDLWNLK